MIPFRPTDDTLAAINYLREHITATVTRTKQDTARQVVVAVEPQQMETPLSRRVTVLLEAWVIKPNKVADPHAAAELMADVLWEMQQAPARLGHVIRFDSLSGPRLVKDDFNVEYAEGSLVWVVS